MTDSDALSRLITSTLVAPVTDDVRLFVQKVVGARRTLGVLFYGAGLRAEDANALLDFYVIVDRLNDWGWPNPLIRVAGALLPPNVVYMRHTVNGRDMHAKIAVMTHTQFLDLTRLTSRDSSIWARFCQPSRLVWVRDDAAADQILRAVKQAVLTATTWGAYLRPHLSTPQELWTTLFQATYRNELRPENDGRAAAIVAAQEVWFSAVLRCACTVKEVPVIACGERVQSCIKDAQRRRLKAVWRAMEASGRWRNAARLMKAAFTFSDGAAYLVDKIARHNGLRLRLSPFEARHPILCLPVLLWRARSILFRR